MATGTTALTTKTSYQTPTVVIKLAGCYSYGVSWKASGTVTAGSMAPGNPKETVLVSPTLTTAIIAGGQTTPTQLSDTVTPVGFSSAWLGGIVWTLYGPVAPINNSCTNVNWTNSPVVATGPTSTTTLASATSPVTANQAGCYSYGETWTGGSSQPGLSTETTLLTTGLGSGGLKKTNIGYINSGGPLGLINTGGGTPSHSPTVIWLIALLALGVVIGLLGDIYRKKSLAVLAVGVILLVGFVAVFGASTTSGPPGSAHPVSAQAIHSLPGIKQTGIPVSVSIPSLGINAPIVPTTTSGTGANKQLLIPANIHTVGWWDNSSPPGTAGTTLLAGHVDWYGQGPGALYHLVSIQAGSQIQLKTSTGAVSNWIAGPAKLESKSYVASTHWTSTGAPTLVLVTCGGPFNATDGQYLDNVVVKASLVGRTA